MVPCPVLAQSGHRLPLSNLPPKPVSFRLLSLGGDNEATGISWRMLWVATTALPPTAHAQQPTTPLIGFLHPGSPEANSPVLWPRSERASVKPDSTKAARSRFEYRWAEGQLRTAAGAGGRSGPAGQSP